METRVAALKCQFAYNFLLADILSFFILIGAKWSRGIFVLVMDELKTGRSLHIILVREIEFFSIIEDFSRFFALPKKAPKNASCLKCL